MVTEARQYVDTELAATVNIGNVGILNSTGSTINPMPSTSGTVEIGDKSGFILSTTSTVPVSFPPSSTVQAVSAPGTGSTVEAHLVDTTATIPVSTVIESAKVGKDTTGTIGYLLTDTSERLITSPSSTVQAVTTPSGTQDVSIVESIALPTTTTSTISTIISSIEDTTSTVPVTFTAPVAVTATDLDIRDLSSATDSVSIPTSSTVQVGSVEGLTIAGGTIGVETEWSPTSTVPITPTFVDSAGTLYDQTLVDTSKRLVLSPTSTVEIGDKTGFTLSTTSTVPVSFSTPVSVTATDLDIRALSSDVDSVSIPTTSTVQVGNLPTDYIRTTGGTVEIGDKTGFTLSTTSTVPVSFATTSTVQAVSAPGTGSTVEAHLISTTSTVPVEFAPTSTVQTVSALTTATSGTTFAVTVTTSTTQILASNANRKSYAVVGNADWYLGFSTGLTTTNGFKLAADQSYVDGGQGVYTGEVWGIVASGTADVRVIEVS